MARYSLDSNIVTAILKKEDVVRGKLNAALTSNHEIIVCPFVYYEVQRGLLDKDAQKQLDALRSFVAPIPWLEFNKEIWNAAAEGWAKSKKVGFHYKDPDPDLLIAYHAQHFSAVVVTANTRHFERFGVATENWRAE